MIAIVVIIVANVPRDGMGGCVGEWIEPPKLAARKCKREREARRGEARARARTFLRCFARSRRKVTVSARLRYFVSVLESE